MSFSFSNKNKGVLEIIYPSKGLRIFRFRLVRKYSLNIHWSCLRCSNNISFNVFLMMNFKKLNFFTMASNLSFTLKMVISGSCKDIFLSFYLENYQVSEQVLKLRNVRYRNGQMKWIVKKKCRNFIQTSIQPSGFGTKQNFSARTRESHSTSVWSTKNMWRVPKFSQS